VFMACYLVKHRDNFALTFTYKSLCQCQFHCPSGKYLRFCTGLWQWCILYSRIYCTSFPLHWNCVVQFRMIKEDEVGGACSTHGRYEKCVQNVYRKTWR